MLRFFEENNISIHLSDLKILQSSSSSKNSSIELFSHKLLGKVLVLNDEIQHIEEWAPLYHENLIHTPISFIPKVKSVLVLGGGSLFAVREVLKYESLEEVVMVEHDKDVIELMQKYYPHVQPILDNPKYQLIVGDIYDFLKTNTRKFDLIVNDALDLLGGNKKMFAALSALLTPHGVCSDVVYRHIFETKNCKQTILELRKKHSTAFSLITIPEYPGILHLLTMWSNSKLVKQDSSTNQNGIQKKWMKTKSNPCVYYDPRFISYYLYLPPYLKKFIDIL